MYGVGRSGGGSVFLAVLTILPHVDHIFYRSEPKRTLKCTMPNAEARQSNESNEAN